MIWASASWKDGLLKDADILERWATKTSRPTQQEVIFEKKIFLTAYAMRKLLEANKICTILHYKPMKFETYDRTNSVMTPLNWDKVEKHYNMETSKSARRDIWWMFDNIIHSHIFLLTINKNGWIDGFLITSDNNKDRYLMKVELSRFLQIMREIGSDYPFDVKWVKKNGKQICQSSCPNHPEPAEGEACYDKKHPSRGFR